MCWWWWKVFIIKYTRFCHFRLFQENLFSIVSRRAVWKLENLVWCSLTYQWTPLFFSIFMIMNYIHYRLKKYILKNTSLMQFHWTLNGFYIFLYAIWLICKFFSITMEISLLVYQVFEILPNRITLNTYMTMSFTRFHNLSCHLKMEKLHFKKPHFEHTN